MDEDEKEEKKPTNTIIHIYYTVHTHNTIQNARWEGDSGHDEPTNETMSRTITAAEQNNNIAIANYKAMRILCCMYVWVWE